MQVFQLCITMLQEHLVQAGSLFKICLTNDPALLKVELRRTSHQLLREGCTVLCMHNFRGLYLHHQAVTVYTLKCLRICYCKHY